MKDLLKGQKYTSLYEEFHYEQKIWDIGISTPSIIVKIILTCVRKLSSRSQPRKACNRGKTNIDAGKQERKTLM